MGVNFGLNAAAILGLFLAVAGAGLFFLRSVRPELARDYDIFFAAIGLLCGIILLFNGWRLPAILELCQFMLSGTAIFFAVDSIRMRGVTTEQARRNTQTVDRDRPVSRTRVYTEAEVDRIDPYDNVYDGAEPNYNSPRLRGYEDPQPRSARRPEPRRRTSPPTEMRDEPRRSRSRNRPAPDDYPDRSRPANRGYPEPERDSRPRRRPATPTSGYDDWDGKDEWDDKPRTSSRPSRRPPRDDRYSQPTSPPPAPKSRPNPPDLADLGRSYEEPEDNYNSPKSSPRNYDSDLGSSYDEPDESIPGDYVVDYQPLDDVESDYSDDYDDGEEDDYDDYDNRQDDNSRDDDDYRDPPERRKPINFE